MSPEEIKERGQRLTDELLNQGDLAIVDELIDPSYAEYAVAEEQTYSAAQLKGLVTDIRRVFPDLHAHTDQQLVDGDTLVQRLTVTGTHDGVSRHGRPPTGRRVQVAVVNISRMGSEGKFVERWTLVDQLAVLRQLGRLPEDSAEVAS